jgi:hypothetical protein
MACSHAVPDVETIRSFLDKVLITMICVILLNALVGRLCKLARLPGPYHIALYTLYSPLLYRVFVLIDAAAHPPPFVLQGRTAFELVLNVHNRSGKAGQQSNGVGNGTSPTPSVGGGIGRLKSMSPEEGMSPRGDL